jgi:hypothetical protein
MWIQQVVSVCSKLRVKIVKGSPIPPISNAPETPPPQNDGAASVRATAHAEKFVVDAFTSTGVTPFGSSLWRKEWFPSAQFPPLEVEGIRHDA